MWRRKGNQVKHICWRYDMLINSDQIKQAIMANQPIGIREKKSNQIMFKVGKHFQNYGEALYNNNGGGGRCPLC